MKKPLTKPCKHCGKFFEKLPTKSMKDWNTRSKYCSRSCLRKDNVAGFTGKNHTEETKEINRRAHLAEKSPVWKGGVDKENRKQRKTFHYKTRTKVFERDNYQCVQCGSDEYITVDHVLPFADFPELRFDIKNCRTLCMYCHYKESFGKELPKGSFWGFNKRFITHTG
jgi:5-methylcytosine-specific restriction endonuclease McrA